MALTQRSIYIRPIVTSVAAIVIQASGRVKLVSRTHFLDVTGGSIYNLLVY
jgi:hypothetical protein